MLLREGDAGSGLEVAFEGESILSALESAVEDKLPRAAFSRAGYLAGVVVFEALLKVLSETCVATLCM